MSKSVLRDGQEAAVIDVGSNSVRMVVYRIDGRAMTPICSISIAAITADIAGVSAVDVGCGTGALLRRVRDARPDLTALAGVDFVIDPELKDEGIRYFAAKVETLPFPDKAFDTVICTHVIEHIVDYRAAIAELRRVARRRMIIVVPREREYRYTFNPHVNFFPYTHSFLRAMMPVPDAHHIRQIGRDIYYREDIGA